MAAPELRLGTRGSQLALWQANTVAASIASAGGPSCAIVVIKTSGDSLQEAPLSEVGGKRLFVKEIEDALLRGDVDLAVHSSKDMPALLPDGLTIAAVLPREDPLDAVVLPRARTSASNENANAAVATIDDLVAMLGRAPSIGTGSVRRIAQLTRLFPGARFTPIRGNLDTRLRKLDEGAHDARGELGAQAEAAVPVRERIHPGDDLVARLPQEQLERLEDRRLDASVAEAFEPLSQLRFETAQPRVVGREYVGRAADTLDRGGSAFAKHADVSLHCGSCWPLALS